MLRAAAGEDALQAARRLVLAGEYEEGARVLRGLLEATPADADALELLGEAMLKRRRWQDGEAAFAQALFVRPDSWAANFGRGFALRRLGRAAESIPCLERALRRRESSAACLAELGAAWLELGDNARAETVLQNALQLQPDSVEVLHIATRMLMAKGDRAGATACLETLLAKEPLHAAGQYLLARLEPSRDDPPLEQLMHAAGSRTRAPAERRDLAFAIALRLEHAGRHEEALDAFVSGNEAQQEIAREAGTAYEPARREREVDRLIGIYGSRSLDSWQQRGLRDERLIFVVGMPRSGTTLTEQLLASHRDVHGAGERPELAVARHAFERLATAESGRVLPRVPPPLVRMIADSYVDALRRSSPAGAVLVDKNPHNFENVGLIRVLFPQARIIHCERDPLDTCLSNYCQVFSVHHSYKNRFEDLAHYYGQYRRLMRHWHATCGDAMHVLRYESLVAAPEPELRKLLEFCGLDWDPSCLGFDVNTRPVNTPSQLQVRRPLYASSVGRARRLYGARLAGLERMLSEAGAG
jgi:tetratricopeptide (TPR) repeat protein